MRVRDFMKTDFATVEPSAPIGEIAMKLSRSNYEIIPVVKNDRTYIGVVSVENLLTTIFPRTAELIDNVNFVISLVPDESTTCSVGKSLFVAEDFADIGYPTVKPGDTMVKTALILKKSRLYSMPVVDNGEIVGMISMNDVANLVCKIIHPNEADETQGR